MNRFLSLISFLLISTSIFSQVDSLLEVLSREDNKHHQVEILLDVAEKLKDKAPGKSRKYSTDALEKARGIKDDHLTGKALLSLGDAYFANKDLPKAKEIYEEAAKIFKKDKHLESHVKSLLKMGLVLKSESKYEEALEKFNEALEVSEKANYKGGISSSINYQGSVYWNQGNYAFSKELYMKALELRKENGSSAEIATSMENVALAYRELGEYDKANHFYKKALDIYQLEGNNEALASTFNFLGSLYWRWSKYDSALIFYKKSLKVREHQQDPLKIAASYSNIALVFNSKYQGDSAMVYYHLAHGIYEKIGDSALVASSYHQIGNYLMKNNSYQEALDYYKKALEIRYSNENKIAVVNTLNTIGTIHGKLNQFEKSFDAFNKSIKILEEVGNKNKLAYTLMLAGNEYSKIDQKKAMEQYQKAIEIYKSVGNKKEIAKCQMNIGRLLYNQGNMASAFVKFQQVVDMLQSLNDLGSLSGLYNEVGNLYLKQRNKGKAISYYSRGATFGEEGNNFEKAGLCHRKLAEIYMEEGNTLKAKPHVEAAVGFGEKANKPELLRDAYYLTYQLKKQQQNHADALYYFEKYTQLNELTGENTRLRQINEFKIRNKEKELKTIKQMMENQGRIQAVKLNQQRNVIIFLIIISLLVIAIIMVLYNQYNIKKKSEAELALLNSTKDKFFSIIAHDIKNPLGGMVGMTQAIERDKNIDPEKMREANSMVNASAKHLYTLLENLLQWARSQTQRIKYSPSAINVKPLLEETASLFKSSASDKNILLSVLLEKDYIVFADKEMITTVARNLISNAIKFTQGGGHVSIDAKIVQDKLIIYIKDTGVGMHPEEKQKLFRLDVHHTTRGTHNEEGTGLGLILCKEFVEKNRGEINVESEKGKGTVFSFTLPLYD